MRVLKGGRLLATSLCLLLSPACNGSDVVLATLPAGDDAATPVRCEGDGDCPAGAYCDKASCDAASGTCEIVPATCDNNEMPSCGCDGVTYFNDCLRKAGGIASSTAMSCQLGVAQTCGGTSDAKCPTGAVCAQLTRTGPPPCPTNVIGECWVLPPQCPAAGPMDMKWSPCGPGAQCVDTCTAIASGGVYQNAPTCH
jgi:hypothetical protein